MIETQTWTEAQRLVRELLRALERIDRLADPESMQAEGELGWQAVTCTRLKAAGRVAREALEVAVDVLGELRTRKVQT